MKYRFFIIPFLLFSVMVPAQQRFFLYPAGIKGITNEGFDTVRPFMDYYPAGHTDSLKTAVLICPGGAYTNLAWDKEGVLPAKFFNDKGIDAFVLRYRLNNDKLQGHQYPAQYNDANAALELIKDKAGEWNINKKKIGIMGFSAGGHLAATVSTLNPLSNDRDKLIPAFSILVYPVITMDTPYVHQYSRKMLLGDHPSAELIDYLSTEKRVSASTPPTLLFHANDDKTVPVQNSLRYFEALNQHKVKASIVVYDHGGHGFGMAQKDAVLSQWPSYALLWLHESGF